MHEVLTLKSKMFHPWTKGVFGKQLFEEFFGPRLAV